MSEAGQDVTLELASQSCLPEDRLCDEALQAGDVKRATTTLRQILPDGYKHSFEKKRR
jgi:hypothetical protein